MNFTTDAANRISTRDGPAGARRGRIELITGCMFAGKTARLIARLTGACGAGRSALAFKHVLDARYDALRLATHDGRCFDAFAVASAAQILEAAVDLEVIGIDEIHFFGDEIVDCCRTLAERGKHVIVVGLDRNAWGNEFDLVRSIKVIADDVEIMTIPCGICGEPARFSERITPIVNGNMVGGPGDYAPRCEKCFRPLTIPPPPCEAASH